MRVELKTREAPVQRLGSRLVFESPWMKLRVDDVRFADGRRSEFGVVERKHFSVVVATHGETLVMVEQYRYPIERWTLELPQGALNDAEHALEAARRELREETGFDSEDWEPVGDLFEAGGFATQRGSVFSCSAVEGGAPLLDSAEQGLRVRLVPLCEVLELVTSGELVDAPSIAALAMAALKNRRIRTLLSGELPGAERQ